MRLAPGVALGIIAIGAVTTTSLWWFNTPYVSGFGDWLTSAGRRLTFVDAYADDWSRNQYAFITLGIVALYAFIAWKGHVYVLGILPVVMSIRSKARNEPLAVVAIIAAAVAVLIAVLGLTHH